MQPNTINKALNAATIDDLAQIDRIANRYVGERPSPGHALSVGVDLILAHNAAPLDLSAFAEAAERDLRREVVGLRANLNRATGELRNHYRSRFSREIDQARIDAMHDAAREAFAIPDGAPV